jgi:hypothetical protein
MHLPRVEAPRCRFEYASALIWRASRRGACPKSRLRAAFATDAVTFPRVSPLLTIKSLLQRWSSVGGPPALVPCTFEIYRNTGFEPRLSVY